MTCLNQIPRPHPLLAASVPSLPVLPPGISGDRPPLTSRSFTSTLRFTPVDLWGPGPPSVLIPVRSRDSQCPRGPPGIFGVRCTPVRFDITVRLPGTTGSQCPFWVLMVLFVSPIVLLGLGYPVPPLPPLLLWGHDPRSPRALRAGVDPRVSQHQRPRTLPRRVEPLERAAEQLPLVQGCPPTPHPIPFLTRVRAGRGTDGPYRGLTSGPDLEQEPVPELVEPRVQHLPEVETPELPVKRVEPRDSHPCSVPTPSLSRDYNGVTGVTTIRRPRRDRRRRCRSFTRVVFLREVPSVCHASGRTAPLPRRRLVHTGLPGMTCERYTCRKTYS